MKTFTSLQNKEFVSKPFFDEKVILSKDSSWPKISIVTPSYNQSKFIEKTILSVLNQNYPNMEYIIIDGGSNDGSLEIIKKYEKYLTYWVSEPDHGQSHALNKGFLKATGDIFAYLNSDDIYMPESLKLISNYFKNISNVHLIYGHSLTIDSNDQITNLLIAMPFKWKEKIFGVSFIHQPSSFWRKDVYFKVGGFNENNKTFMDAEFYIRANKLNYKFLNINEILSCFRIHKDSITCSNRFYQNRIFNLDKFTMEFLGRRVNKMEYKIMDIFYQLKYFPKIFIIKTWIKLHTRS